MAVLIAVLSPSFPVWAKDGERSASRHEALVAAQPFSSREDVSTSSSRSRIFDDGSVRQDTFETSRERKALTLFRINSKFGDIAVQPVFGSIKGAQFSLGF